MNNQAWFKKKIVIERATIFGFYFISYALLLVNTGIYWDDWVWSGNSFQDYLIISQKLYALRYPGFVMALFYLLPTMVAHVLTFVCYFIPGLLLHHFLEQERWPARARVFISIIFLILPLNLTRYILATAPYSLYYAIFSVAVYLFLNNRNGMLKLLSLPLFIFSFALNSLLAIYAVPFMYAFFKHRREDGMSGLIGFRKSLCKYLSVNWYYAITPFMYFVFKFYAMKTNQIYIQGVYSSIEYNKINLMNMIFSPFHALVWLVKSFADLTIRAGEAFRSNLGIGVSIVVVVVYLILGKDTNRSDSDVKIYKKIAVFGLFAFFFGVLAYIAVGKEYAGDTLNSRDNILISFGLSFLLYAVGELLVTRLGLNKSFVDLLAILVFVSYTLFNLGQGKAFYFDNIKQQSIIMNLKQLDEVQNGKAFIVVDNTRYLNAGRTYNHYDFSGLLSKAFSDEKRLAVYAGPEQLDELKGAYDGRYILPYKAKDATSYEPTHLIKIHEKDSNTGYSSCLKLVLDSFFNKYEYEEKVAAFLFLTIEPLKK